MHDWSYAMPKMKRILRSVEPFKDEPRKNPKYCVGCGKIATQIAYFDADGATVIEGYCDKCVKSVS